MTDLYWIGLLLAIAAVLGLGVGIRLIARAHWNSRRGLLWREASGFGLIATVATVYSWAFGLSLLPLGVLWLLAGVVLLAILLLDRVDALQDEPWEGLTDGGNLTHGSIRRIENALAGVVRARDSHRRVERELEEQEVDLLMAWLLLGDLRYMRPVSSVEELRRRVEERLKERTNAER